MIQFFSVTQKPTNFHRKYYLYRRILHNRKIDLYIDDSDRDRGVNGKIHALVCHKTSLEIKTDLF
jgi:hypothetical protein